MQLTPSVKLGSFPSSDNPTKFAVQFKPNLWDDATLPINVSDRAADANAVAPPNSERNFRKPRSLDSPSPRPQSMKEKALQEMRRNKLREREKAMLPPGKHKFQSTFPPTVVFDLRDCAKCHKSLKLLRQDRWESGEVDQEAEASPRRLCKGMHTPARSTSGVSSVGLKLREKMTQELLHRYSGSLDWEKGSHISCNSMKELILTHGHATEVPESLRQLEPAGKVNAWLSRD